MLGHARRWVRRLLVGYAAALVVFHSLMAGAVLVARVLGHDPRDSRLGSVDNLRRVDERVWAGAQPDQEQYRELAAAGVRLVIDLRTGRGDDRREDDPELLASLGVRYLSLPVPDGHVPSPETIDRIVREVQATDGITFLHCGGGVGRSASAQAAYLAATGRDPSWPELVAIGPITLQQLWFLGAVDSHDPHVPNIVVRRVSELLDAPRRAWSILRAL